MTPVVIISEKDNSSQVIIRRGGGSSIVTGDGPPPGPSIVQDGLFFYVDAGNSTSYPGTGTTWFDLSGNSRNFTLFNNPTFNSENGGAFTFAGTPPAYAQNTFSGRLYPPTNGGVSVCGWVRTPSTFNSGIFSSWPATQWSIGTRTNSFGFLDGTFGMFSPQIRTGTKLAVNTWYHLAYSHVDNNPVYLYVNGNLVHQTGNLSFQFAPAQASIGAASTLGAPQNANTGWNGRVAIIQSYYNKALSGTEILQNYNVDKARFGY